MTHHRVIRETRMARMDYASLPPDWPTRPLTDPEIAAAVVDLCTPVRDRHASLLGMLLCHPNGRLMQPVLVTDVPRRLPRVEKARTLRSLLGGAKSCGASVVLTIGSRNGALTGDVAAWLAEARTACEELTVPLLGVYLASGAGVHPLYSCDKEAA